MENINVYVRAIIVIKTFRLLTLCTQSFPRRDNKCTHFAKLLTLNQHNSDVESSTYASVKCYDNSYRKTRL